MKKLKEIINSLTKKFHGKTKVLQLDEECVDVTNELQSIAQTSTTKKNNFTKIERKINFNG